MSILPLPFIARAFAAMCLLVCTLGAQSEILVSEGPLVAGEDIKIGVEDPARANQTVTVTIDSGDPDDDPEKIEIELDEHGSGKIVLECPYWPELVVSEPESSDVRRLVLPALIDPCTRGSSRFAARGC